MLILGDPVAGMLPGGVRGGKVDYSADPTVGDAAW